MHFAEVGRVLALFGGVLLSITAFSIYCRHIQRKNLERIERANKALAAKTS